MEEKGRAARIEGQREAGREGGNRGSGRRGDDARRGGMKGGKGVRARSTAARYNR